MRRNAKIINSLIAGLLFSQSAFCQSCLIDLSNSGTLGFTDAHGLNHAIQSAIQKVLSLKIAPLFLTASRLESEIRLFESRYPTVTYLRFVSEDRNERDQAWKEFSPPFSEFIRSLDAEYPDALFLPWLSELKLEEVLNYAVEDLFHPVQIEGDSIRLPTRTAPPRNENEQLRRTRMQIRLSQVIDRHGMTDHLRDAFKRIVYYSAEQKLLDLTERQYLELWDKHSLADIISRSVAGDLGASLRLGKDAATSLKADLEGAVTVYLNAVYHQ